MRGRAAIITQNPRLAELIRAELEICGCETEVSAGELTSPEYDLLIVDTDTVTSAELLRRGVTVTVSERYSESRFFEPFVLAYPVRLSDIDRLCLTVIPLDLGERGSGEENENTVYVIDPEAGTVQTENALLKLTKTEFLLLETLCSAEGEPIGRERIAEILGESDGNKVDVYICRLRKKLETPSGKRTIVTCRGRGYGTSLVLRK